MGGRSLSGVFFPSCLWVSSEVPAAVRSLGSNNRSGRRTSGWFRVMSPQGVVRVMQWPNVKDILAHLGYVGKHWRDTGAAVLGWPQALDGGHQPRADAGLEWDPRHSSFRNARSCASFNSANPFLFHPIPVTHGRSVCVHSM